MVFDRLGDSLLRAPYVWTLATVLVIFFLTPSMLLGVAAEPGDGNAALAVGVSLLTVYNVVTGLVLVPRALRSAGPDRMPPNRAAAIRWALSWAAWLVGVGATAAGAEQWGLSVSIIGSLILLVATARWLRRDAQSRAKRGPRA